MSKAIQLRPSEASFRAAKAELYYMAGKIEPAASEIEPLLKVRPANQSVTIIFSKLCIPLKRISEGLELVEDCLRQDHIMSGMRTQLLFARADLLYEQERYDEAMEAYHKANESRGLTFNIEEYSKAVDRMIAVWRPEVIAKLPVGDPKTHVPVFIVGMPRSGTSLVEQILASHPKVFGAGELTEMPRINRDLNNDKSGPALLATLETLTPLAMREHAQQYLAVLTRGHRSAERITDKMPMNFQCLGLISRLFPNARIIHCKRNPIDTCVSCYFHLFSGYLSFTYNLSSLGSFYREYERLMNHWKAVGIPILDVVYEELVANPEMKSREMIEYLGLEWDPACLEPHKTERITLTSSNVQVRNPVSQSAIGQYHHFEAHLGPLRAALAGGS